MHNFAITISYLLAVIKGPPYAVSEQGYGGFNLPIEVFFKSNGPEPARYVFYYVIYSLGFLDSCEAEVL